MQNIQIFFDLREKVINFVRGYSLLLNTKQNMEGVS